MPPDYTTAQLMADVMGVVQDAVPTIVAVSIFLAAVNFALTWFLWAITSIATKSFGKY